MKNIQSIRGMNDCLPGMTTVWQYIEDVLKKTLHSYGYKEIRFPIVEQTSLFERAIGEISDVIEKEMYTFTDKKGNSLTLRPEGTASCVRAGIAHGLLYNQEQRLWYTGPMFRYERPQKGRYRQFHQLGVEVFGLQGPDIDAEIIMLSARWWRILGITKYVSLELNSIASPEARTRYCKKLVSFLEQHKEKLDDDCKRRMDKNPLRVLDSKNPQIKVILEDAPVINDYLDDESRYHFEELCKLLKILGITYNINRNLVRGLDYYNKTVFEWVTRNLGSQEAICAGGRYDNLVEQLGGRKTPAVGLAVGLERLILLTQIVNPKLEIESFIDIYLIALNLKMQYETILLAERIRDALPDVKLVTNYNYNNFKKRFSYVSKCGARVVLMVGESENMTSKILVKDLRTGEQKKIIQDQIIVYLRTLLGYK